MWIKAIAIVLIDVMAKIVNARKAFLPLCLSAGFLVLSQTATGWTTTGVTGVWPETGNPKSGLGAEFSHSYSLVNATVSTTTLKYTLYKDADTTASSINWLTNLSVSYSTKSGKTGSIKTYSTTVTSVAANPITLKVDGELLENTTTVTREFAVMITLGNSYFPPVWFVIQQEPGVNKVKVTLLPNGGTEPKPFSTYEYKNGGVAMYIGNPSSGYMFNSGYKQTTMSGPTGAVTTEQLIQYANSFVMPTTTREGYVFDAWYTVSTKYPEANNIRIDEMTKPTAKVNAISARWLLPPLQGITATTDREDMVYLSWKPSSADVEYVIYRSESEKKPSDYLARCTTCFYEDETAKAGRTYYYWVDANDGATTSVEGQSVVGARALPRVATPTFSFPDGDEFMTDSKAISMKCATDGATIRYTTDGSDPDESSTVFSKKFSIYATTTFKAAAFKDGMRRSEIASATIVKVKTVPLAEALDTELSVVSGGDGDWLGYLGTTAKVGDSYVKSQPITDGESSWITMTVSGAGTFSFWWRTSCEHDDTGNADWDAAIFSAPDADRAEIRCDGIMNDWSQVTAHFTTSGNHTLKWTYKKDEMDSDGEDCLYLDGFIWSSTTADGRTTTTPVPVGHDWLSKYPSLLSVSGGDFESAAMLSTGKKDIEGNELCVWHDYVAGTDPTNKESIFSAKIEMENGHPLVRWKPDLNEDGAKALRNYKIWGKESLGEESLWQYPTNALHRFFKVTVEMP